MARLRSAGVRIRLGVELGRNLSMQELVAQFDAVVLSVGLGATPAVGLAGEEQALDGLAYIEASKTERATFRVGNDVIVIGAGNT